MYIIIMLEKALRPLVKRNLILYLKKLRNLCSRETVYWKSCATSAQERPYVILEKAVHPLVKRDLILEKAVHPLVKRDLILYLKKLYTVWLREALHIICVDNTPRNSTLSWTKTIHNSHTNLKFQSSAKTCIRNSGHHKDRTQPCI